jgi:hypothetical protein
MESRRSDHEAFRSMLDRMGIPYKIKDNASIRAAAERDRENWAGWGEDLKTEHHTLAWLAGLHHAPEEVAARARTAVELHDGEMLFLFGRDGEYLGYGEWDGSNFYPPPREGLAHTVWTT